MVRKKTWCCLATTALTLIVGVALFSLAWLGQYGIQAFIKDQIYQQVIVDSPVRNPSAFFIVLNGIKIIKLFVIYFFKIIFRKLNHLE